MMSYSTFGQKFGRMAGITQLMEDMNDGLRDPKMIMLGGGSPAQIPLMIHCFNDVCCEMAKTGELVEAMACYDAPRGNCEFIEELARLFNELYGWNVSQRNFVLTNGSQSAFFSLFNLLAGTHKDGKKKKIMLPVSPEFVGYMDSGLQEEMFVSCKPNIALLDERMFKYGVDFSRLVIDDSIGAICVSRPSNPSGNLLTDEEVNCLDELARSHNIPLILDYAYGIPFPQIIFREVNPTWNSNTIMCFSLSKLGLPGARCGIVLASEEIATTLANMNGPLNLAPGSIGPALGTKIFERHDISRLSRQVIKPYYMEKSRRVINMLLTAITDPRFRIHCVEGAIFLWLWFKDLPISTMELYLRLKKQGVLVMPGKYFFIGLDEDWHHAHECIRVNYAQDDELTRQGVQIIAQEVRKAYGEPQCRLAGMKEQLCQAVTNRTRLQ